jgi:hypothetical protein
MSEFRAEEMEVAHLLVFGDLARRDLRPRSETKTPS